MTAARRTALAATAAALVVAATAVAPAAPTTRIVPGQRIDVKVLLLSADGTEPGFGAWKTELAREGVPHDTFVAYNGATKGAALTDDRLADYGADHARYDAVILATGDLGHTVANAGGTTSYLSALTDAEWSTLDRFERTFGIRRLSDATAPSPAHGLNVVGGAAQDGVVGTLTATGKAAFPYLKGPVPFADDRAVAETFGYAATPVNPQNWQTLLAGSNNTALLGIYAHPDDGREEMVMTVAGNENQSQVQLLRHGMLNWVTRGVFLGFQRQYLEVQIDHMFSADDAWDTGTHATAHDPGAAGRVTPADVAQAVVWSQARGIRLDFAYNGGGSRRRLAQADSDAGTAGDAAADPLVTAFRNPVTRNAFGWINDTFDRPNLDCSTATFITREITDNVTWGRRHELPLDPSDVVTGDHSGLADSRPGDPDTLRPPSFADVVPATTAGAAVPAGDYDYAITARSPAGETTASAVRAITVAAAANSVVARFPAVCHATTYNLYRRAASGGDWALVGTLDHPADAATDDGSTPVVLSITDAVAAGAAGAPPAINRATIAPYGQNPDYLAGLVGAGVTYTATDASKTYPVTATEVGGPQFPIGATFWQGTPGAGFQTVPRYPSSVYYNVSKQAQQLDEYNSIHVAPPSGACVPSPLVTTCRTAAATWAEYVSGEDTVMFGRLMGNDPRPHVMHQSNLADYDPALPETDPDQGGVLYPVLDGLLRRYDIWVDRASTPLIQLTGSQIAATLSRQSAWAANLAAGKVSAWLQDGRLHVRNSDSAPMDVPLTGTTIGDLYGGQKSGWTTVPAAAEAVFSPSDPANTGAPAVSGSARVGGTLSAGTGTWSGSSAIGYGYQWQRCNAQGTGCANIAGATASTYPVVASDDGARLRVVVSAGNWISSVGHAASAATAAVRTGVAPIVFDGPGVSGGVRPTSVGAGGKQRGGAGRLALTSVAMSPRSFALTHQGRPDGTRLDGSRITWALNRAATVRLTFELGTGAGKQRRWVTVGTITRSAKAGTGVVRFTGRFGARALPPSDYRVSVTASDGGETAGPMRLTFRVVGG